MKVEQLLRCAGPDGVSWPGQILDLDPKEARARIEAGAARLVEEEVEEPPPAAKKEPKK